jgi:hypothetical protein
VCSLQRALRLRIYVPHAELLVLFFWFGPTIFFPAKSKLLTHKHALLILVLSAQFVVVVVVVDVQLL